MTDRQPGNPPDEPPDADDDPFEYPADEAATTDRESGGLTPTGESDSPSGVVGWIQHVRTVDSGALVYFRDAVTSVLIVVAIGLLLFAASGVWPPMVAVISDSMEPNMERGDLVLIVDNERFVPEQAVATDGGTTGVVPAKRAEQIGDTAFSRPGDVVVFHRNGNERDTPIIHRSMFWVDAGENWYDRADPSAIGGAENCEELEHCPSPHAGFITKGDNRVTNPSYDQVSRLSAPVRPGWIVGTAELRIPYLGHVRLLFSSVTVSPIDAASASEETPRSSGDEPVDAGNATVSPALASPRPA
jgi:signal peptidase